jgi:quinol-cytochrome oxidoreductase complex cytochrome b subunit/mono/diheme cytochrome c family protein
MGNGAKKLLSEVAPRGAFAAWLRAFLDERIPGGARFVYVFGSALVILFGVQAITGVGLALYYSPSANNAWASVFYIQHKVALGQLLRGLHHYGASAMIIVLGLHLVQTFTFGAYKQSRAFVWWSGLLLLFITIAFGLTGYLLPWDQKGYWATRVATDIIATLPAIGRPLQYALQGGNEYGNLTLTRFYAIHVVILPVLLAGIVAGHVALFRRMGGITPSWRLLERRPDPVAKRRLLVLAVAALLFAAGLASAAFLPLGWAVAVACAAGGVPIASELARSAGKASGKDDPRVVGEFWPDQLARNAVFSLAVVGILALLSAYRPASLDAPADPTVNYLPRPDWYFLFLFQLLKYFEGSLVVVGTILIPGLTCLVLIALPLLDRGEVRSPLSPERAPFVALMYSIVAGVFLLTYLAIRADQRNPEVQRLRREADRSASRAIEVAQNGIPPEGAAVLLASDPREQGRRLFHKSCESCHSLDGAGGTKAPDLTGYLSRSWIAGLIRNPEDARYYGKTKLHEMESYASLGEAQIGRLSDFLVTLSAHDVAPERYPPELEEGLKLYQEVGCESCHSLQPGEESAAPNLAGYGGPRWLREFLRDPGAGLFYGKDNEMPAFGKRLSPDELESVVAFLRDLAPSIPHGQASATAGSGQHAEASRH